MSVCLLFTTPPSSNIDFPECKGQCPVVPPGIDQSERIYQIPPMNVLRYSPTDVFLNGKPLQRPRCLSQAVGIARGIGSIELSSNGEYFRENFEREVFK